jgi:hypothetical protein
MPFTEAQIENQLQANYDTLMRVADQLQHRLPAWKSAQLDQEMNRVWQAQQYWAQEYKRTTGKSWLLIKPFVIRGDAQEENRLLAEAKLKESQAKQVRDALYTVDQDYQRLRLMLQSQYDIAVEWQNALFSHWARLGAGSINVRHPLILKKMVEDRVRPAVEEANKLLAQGKYQQALEKAAYAARCIKWGFDGLSAFMDKLDTGGARAIAGIKISASLAALIASGGAASGVLGFWGTTAVAATGEGAIQGTTLILQAIDPNMSVSTDDVKNAALAVVINGATAGAGKGLGMLVSRGIAGKVLSEVLENGAQDDPLRQQLRARIAVFVSAKIEAYVTANAQAIANKMLKLDKSPDWNWWYMIVAPMINPAIVELAKEPDMQGMLKKK